VSGEVVGIKGQPVVDPRQPDENAIAGAEWLLEQCKSGEVSGFAIVVGYSDSATGKMKAGVMTVSMLGRLEIMKMDIVQDLRG
jgi:hypothetical protein